MASHETEYNGTAYVDADQDMIMNREAPMAASSPSAPVVPEPVSYTHLDVYKRQSAVYGQSQ